MSGEALTRLRRALMRLSRSLRTASAEEGLTPTESSVLATLMRVGPCRSGDLAAAEALNPTMLSRVVGRLEAQGLAARSTDPDDARATIVRATTAGRRRMRSLRARRGALLQARLESLSAAEIDDILRALPALEALADEDRA
jgi:DNA-binding MarR family transcriptional regulator